MPVIALYEISINIVPNTTRIVLSVIFSFCIIYHYHNMIN